MFRVISIAAPLFALALAAPAIAADPDWAAVAKALGKEGTVMQPGAVYRVGFPRSDLSVTLDGVAIKPGLALGGWLAFEPTGDHAVMMGDLVLTQDEIAPVMRKLAQGGIDVTAVHNHLLRSNPGTMYMHVMAMGDPVKLATAVHDALAASKTPFAAPAAAAPAPADLDIPALDKLMGASGKDNGGIVQYSVPRAENITDGGVAVPPAMGSAIAINFQPLGGGKAAITGDFVLIASEVEPAMKALVDNGIEVTALHSHMVDEMPRLYFMHFWGNDDAQKLAKGLRATLDKLNLAKG
jgi:Domain of Unknown Function (DUF1259)